MWRQLSHIATANGDLKLAGECMEKSKDYGGLMLLATSIGSHTMVYLDFIHL